MGGAHAPTHHHSESGTVLRMLYRYGAKVVGVHINAVVTRMSNTDLELPGQIREPVQRLRRRSRTRRHIGAALLRCTSLLARHHNNLRLCSRRHMGAALLRCTSLLARHHNNLRLCSRRHRMLAIHPHVVVAAALGSEPLRQRTGHTLENVVATTRQWGWAALHITVDIAARRQCGDQLGVQRPDQRSQVTLADEVILHPLASGEAQGAVGHLIGHLVQTQPLFAGECTARDAGSDHEDVVHIETLGLQRLALVAIILGIDAVELEEHLSFVGDARFGPRQLHRHVAPKPVAGGLDVFDATHVAYGSRER